MTTTNIYLELDSDILELIESNVDISEILRSENIDAEVTYGVGPYLSCLLYTSPSPRDTLLSRMPSSA